MQTSKCQYVYVEFDSENMPPAVYLKRRPNMSVSLGLRHSLRLLILPVTRAKSYPANGQSTRTYMRNSSSYFALKCGIHALGWLVVTCPDCWKYNDEHAKLRDGGKIHTFANAPKLGHRDWASFPRTSSRNPRAWTLSVIESISCFKDFFTTILQSQDLLLKGGVDVQSFSVAFSVEGGGGVLNPLA